MPAPLYYQRHLFFCTNVRPEGHALGCCSAKGAVRLRNYMKARCQELAPAQKKLQNIRVNTAGCLDRCVCGPVMVIYPEGVWYRYETKADIEEIIEIHLIQGQIVNRLLLKQDD